MPGLQVWANCRAYNPEGTIVRQMGDRLSDTWEKKWYQQGVEAKWEGLMRELKEEDVRSPPACCTHSSICSLGSNALSPCAAGSLFGHTQTVAGCVGTQLTPRLQQPLMWPSQLPKQSRPTRCSRT